MKSIAETGIFAAASDDTLELIAKMNTSHQHTFLIPTRFISAESGQVGYLLNEYINWNREPSQEQTYRTFVANSGFEALQGAIKLVRHHWHKQAETEPRSIVLHDPTLKLTHFIDPLGRGDKDALIPGIQVVASLDEVATRLDGRAGVRHLEPAGAGVRHLVRRHLALATATADIGS